MCSSDDYTSRFTKYLDLQAERLRIDLQAARLFIGTSDIGNVAENAVRRFLSSNLPTRYAVGVGEVIAPDGQSPPRIEQTQQKDVLIYDPYGCTIVNWDENEVSLYPVESIYGILEVKTSIGSKEDLLKAVKQALEAKKLVQAHQGSEHKSPFTGVFVFESRVIGDTLFEALHTTPVTERADFVFVLNPPPSDSSNQRSSFYFVHWHYYGRGGGPIKFVSADQTAQERSSDRQQRDKFLTFCDTERALLWFYLFLVEELDSMRLTKPNLWEYARADRERLGWRHDES
jgi:hypothetical protein